MRGERVVDIGEEDFLNWLFQIHTCWFAEIHGNPNIASFDRQVFILSIQYPTWAAHSCLLFEPAKRMAQIS